jgi:phosphoribosylanthranilate isomerase
VVASIRAVTQCVIWKTVWLRTHGDLNEAIELYGSTAHGLLLDARHEGRIGGTGARFDWSLAAATRAITPDHLQVIAAGGLTPANVRAAVRALAPDVVDVASGVESAPGQKSEAAITAFVRNARI